MSPEQIEVERKAFEAFAAGGGGNITHHPENQARYASATVQGWWKAWLARAEKAQRVRDALEALISVSMAVVCCPSDINAYLATIEKRSDAARAALND